MFPVYLDHMMKGEKTQVNRERKETGSVPLLRTTSGLFLPGPCPSLQPQGCNEYVEGANSSRPRVLGLCCPLLIGQGRVRRCKGLVRGRGRTSAHRRAAETLIIPIKQHPCLHHPSCGKELESGFYPHLPLECSTSSDPAVLLMAMVVGLAAGALHGTADLGIHSVYRICTSVLSFHVCTDVV
ncbi:uncharacterized protein LOC134807825 isoform X2 [Pan troglodytes]|uniref:uncharacterized protein LOC134807825 isoform X2 n=1 Tax=Pan troglodytes TaxID=9598 RepID=UPI0030136D8E